MALNAKGLILAISNLLFKDRFSYGKFRYVLHLT